MRSFVWMKLWIEILDDMKVAPLPDHLWRRMVEMFLLAKEHDDDGNLPPLEQMAWRLRMQPERLEADLADLAERTQARGEPGVVQAVDGQWVVTNLAKRQEPMTDAKRKREQRKRERDGFSHDGVTCRDLEEQRTEAEVEAEVEVDTEAEANAARCDAPAVAAHAQKAKRLAEIGVGNPKREQLAASSWVTLERIDAWWAEIQTWPREEVRIPSLIKRLEGKRDPPKGKPGTNYVYDEELESWVERDT